MKTTGLLDKNGIEIKENDIILCHIKSNYHSQYWKRTIYNVVWRENQQALFASSMEYYGSKKYCEYHAMPKPNEYFTDKIYFEIVGHIKPSKRQYKMEKRGVNTHAQTEN